MNSEQSETFAELAMDVKKYKLHQAARERFEEWAETEFAAKTRRRAIGPREYTGPAIQSCWQAWQAASPTPEQYAQAARQIASGNEALHALGLPPNNAAQTLHMLTSILGQPQNEPHDPTRHSELRTGKATGINLGPAGRQKVSVFGPEREFISMYQERRFFAPQRTDDLRPAAKEWANKWVTVDGWHENMSMRQTHPECSRVGFIHEFGMDIPESELLLHRVHAPVLLPSEAVAPEPPLCPVCKITPMMRDAGGDWECPNRTVGGPHSRFATGEVSEAPEPTSKDCICPTVMEGPNYSLQILPECPWHGRKSIAPEPKLPRRKPHIILPDYFCPTCGAGSDTPIEEAPEPKPETSVRKVAPPTYQTIAGSPLGTPHPLASAFEWNENRRRAEPSQSGERTEPQFAELKEIPKLRMLAKMATESPCFTNAILAVTDAYIEGWRAQAAKDHERRGK